MPIFPLQLYKDYLMLSYVHQDAAFAVMAEAAEDYVARHCGFRLTPSSDSKPVIEAASAQNGVIRPRARPIISVVSVKDISTGTVYLPDSFTASRQFVEGGFPDGESRYQVTYFAGYSPANMPAGLRGAMLEVFRRYHVARDDAAVDLSGIDSLLAPYRFSTGFA